MNRIVKVILVIIALLTMTGIAVAGGDPNPPTGTVQINTGDEWAKSTAVTLTLSATDDMSVTEMRFSRDGSTWESWGAYATTASFDLQTPYGESGANVFAQFRDAALNESEIVSDYIKLDRLIPTASISAPALASGPANGNFTVTWSGRDYLDGTAEPSGIASYDVQYKKNTGGAWTNWKTGTTATSDVFQGDPGTYYFRAQSADKAGNMSEFSPTVVTVVPLNQKAFSMGPAWRLRKGSLLSYGDSRFTGKAGAKATYKFANAYSVSLIVTKRPNGGYADVFIGKKKIKTVSLYASSVKTRKIIKVKSSSSKFSGVLKVVVKGTHPAASKGNRVEIDGLAIRR